MSTARQCCREHEYKQQCSKPSQRLEGENKRNLRAIFKGKDFTVAAVLTTFHWLSAGMAC